MTMMVKGATGNCHFTDKMIFLLLIFAVSVLSEVCSLLSNGINVIITFPFYNFSVIFRIVDGIAIKFKCLSKISLTMLQLIS